MISAGLSWNDVTKPFFMEPNKARVNAQYYTNYILKRLIPAWLKMYPDNDYYFMQNGASSHTSKLSQNFLQVKHFTIDSSIRTNGHPNLLILTFLIIIFGSVCLR